MKKLYILIFAILLNSSLSSQSVAWAIPSNFPAQEVGLLTDKNSNLYQFGYTMNEIPEYNISQGSMIRKISPSGARLADFVWNTKIFLNEMVYDGTGNFYFVANFYDTVNLGSFQLVSKGKFDGLVGKMDENGKVEWITSFGGPNYDEAKGIALNDTKTEVIVTGNVDSTAFLMNTSLGQVEKNLVIAVLDLNGKLKNYKLFDFDAQRTGPNMGLEILNSPNGYFMLADREGAEWWIEPMPAGPQQGRYLMSLDKDFNILWQEYIINNGCYYGYSCENISAANGDCYVPRFCSGKYGGTGQLARRDGIRGTATWTLGNQDGSYSDTYAYAKTLYYVGIEEAFHCPCPEFDPGSAVLKILDADNNGRVLMKKYGYHFSRLTRGLNGTLYVSGSSNGDVSVIGEHNMQSRKFIFAMKDPTSSIVENPNSPFTFNVYPNPSIGQFQVTADKQIDEIVVTNLSGAVVYRNTAKAYSLAVPDLQPGCYAIRVKCGESVNVGKVIIGN